MERMINDMMMERFLFPFNSLFPIYTSLMQMFDYYKAI